MAAKHRVIIKFTADKNGRRRAHYWGLAKRWLPISIDTAELKIAAGAAILHEGQR